MERPVRVGHSAFLSSNAFTSFHSLHSALDGRGSLQMFDIFVRFLNDLVCKGATPPSVSENWGEETKRLLPCVSLLVIRQLGLPLETLLPKPPNSFGASSPGYSRWSTSGTRLLFLDYPISLIPLFSFHS